MSHHLCNVTYKIITELSNFWSLISQEQGGFVKSHQILDGVIVSSEAVHSMSNLKQKSMFIKLDMSKAYDKVHWSFLKSMLFAFGFCGAWIDWIMSCVTSSSSVLINGIPSPNFSTSHGLRQGDLLSPYLFILMV